jgi:uncharacterized protein (TIGR02246 family)
MNTQPASDVRAAILQANQQFMTSARRGDAASIAALYTASAELLPTNSDVVSGVPAIRAFWQAVLDMGIKEATLETVELEAHGNTAYEVGRYVLHGDGSQILDRGKYVVIWKREDGRWKLHRDIWNTSLPASPADRS